MGDRVRVLFISIGLEGGGVRDSYTYNFVTKEMEALVRKGVDVYFFHERFSQEECINGVKCVGGKYFSEVTRCSLLLSTLRHSSMLLKPLLHDVRRTLWAIKINMAIANLVKDLEVDVIHTHFMYPIGLACSILKEVVSVPVLSTLRGAELHNRPELDYGACRDPLYRELLDMGLSSSDFITAPNPEMIRVLNRDHRVSSKKAALVPNGFETLQPTPIDCEFFEPDSLNLLSVGNCISLKNHQLLIEAVKSFCVEHYDTKVRVVIVGKGVLSKQLKSTIGEAPIRIIDEMKKNDLSAYLQRADALVHASLLEGMPNVVLEALSLGTLCLVSDISAHRMLIKPGVNGYIFDPHSSNQLKLLIMKLESNKELMSSMSKDCIDLSKKYSLDRKVGRYLEIYKMLISASKEEGAQGEH